MDMNLRKSERGMRRILYFALTLVAVCGLATSCLDDNDGNTKTTVTYAGVLSRISYADSADTVFDSFIASALKTMKVTNNAWQEKVELDYTTSYNNVWAIANSQAITTYQKTLDSLKLSDVKSAIYKEFSDTITQMGYSNASAIPLDRFTGTFLLMSILENSTVIDTLYKEVR